MRGVSTFLALACAIGATFGSALAGPLQQASVSKIVNEVKVVEPKVGARPAVVDDMIKGETGVRTGAESRTELLFQDATLTRLGSETYFSFVAGTRDLKLERGTMLLQVPKNLGGTKIRTAAVTAAITGTTIMMEYIPGKHTKVVVLEGSLRLELPGRWGQSVLLEAGKMVLMKNNAKTLPTPVDVDLRKLMKTSSLIDPKLFRGKTRIAVNPLPSEGLIAQEIAKQDKLKGGSELIDTNLLIKGSGNKVTVASDGELASLGQKAPGSAVNAPGTLDQLIGVNNPASPANPLTRPENGGQLGSATGGIRNEGPTAPSADSLIKLDLLDVPATMLAANSPTGNPASTPERKPLGATVSDTTAALIAPVTNTGAAAPEVLASMPEVTKTVPTVVSSIAPAVAAAVPAIVNAVPEVVSAVPAIVNAVPEVVSSVPAIVNSVPDVVSSAPAIVNTVPEVVSSLPAAVGQTVPEVVSSVPAVVEAIPEVVASVPEIVSNLPLAGDLLGAIPTAPSTSTPTAPTESAPSTGLLGGVLNTVADLTSPVTTPATTQAAEPELPSAGQVLETSALTAGQALQRDGANGSLLSGPSAGESFELRGPSLEIATTSVNGISARGGNATGLGQKGGDGGVISLGTTVRPIAGSILVNAPITATTGTNSLGVSTGGKGGTVNLVANGPITVRNRIQVSESAGRGASAQGGNINIESRATGQAIVVENSAQLLALLSSAAPGPGGTIRFSAPNGDISIKDSTVRADRGTITLQTEAANGTIQLQNVNLRGDVVKAVTMGTDGRLIVGGGTIDADSAIKLYATGSRGEVQFVDNVTLKGSSTKTIAGYAVTINNGKTVTIGGSLPAQVFTDKPNYRGSGGNGSTTGKFGGAGAITKPFGQRPAY